LPKIAATYNPGMLANTTFLDALARKPTPYTPVWLMRQAGRYLPEYRASRAKAGSFMDLVRSRAFCAEVTLQPIDRYPLDAAIVFSDILTVPDAFGLELSFTTGEGPRFAKPLRTADDVAKLVPPPMEHLQYVFDAVSECKRALKDRVPLIGFAGSPFTLACYAIEGGGSDGFPLTKSMMYSAPLLFQRIIDLFTETVSDYLLEQSRAGADVLMIFDSWGGVLGPAEYRRYSLASMQRVLDALTKHHVKTIIFSKGAAGHSLQQMARTGADGIGLDWTADLATARSAVGAQVALQGNVDPLVVTTTGEAVQAAVAACISAAGPAPGHLFNLGHGLTPASRPELVSLLIDEVHRLSAEAFEKNKKRA
jgi:uroporphyrinogen decarboxylase